MNYYYRAFRLSLWIVTIFEYWPMTITHSWWISEATVLAQNRRCFFMLEDEQHLGIFKFSSGESGLFISHASDKYGLMMPLFCSSASIWFPSTVSVASITPSLCKPGITLIILGLRHSFLNVKPRSIKPFTSSSSSSPSVLQLMDFCSFLAQVVVAGFLNFLWRFWVDGEDECERVLLSKRFILVNPSFLSSSLLIEPSFVAVKNNISKRRRKNGHGIKLST